MELALAARWVNASAMRRRLSGITTSAQEGGIIDACPSLRTTHGDAEKPARSPERGGWGRRARRKLIRSVVHAVFRRRQHRVPDNKNPGRRHALAAPRGRP